MTHDTEDKQPVPLLDALTPEDAVRDLLMIADKYRASYDELSSEDDYDPLRGIVWLHISARLGEVAKETEKFVRLAMGSNQFKTATHRRTQNQASDT